MTAMVGVHAPAYHEEQDDKRHRRRGLHHKLEDEVVEAREDTAERHEPHTEVDCADGAQHICVQARVRYVVHRAQLR